MTVYICVVYWGFDLLLLYIVISRIPVTLLKKWKWPQNVREFYGDEFSLPMSVLFKTGLPDCIFFFMWEIAVFLSDGLIRRGGSSEVLRGRGQFTSIIFYCILNVSGGKLPSGRVPERNTGKLYDVCIFSLTYQGNLLILKTFKFLDVV